MVAGFVLRLDGKEGSGDAGSLHRAVVLLSCRNIAIKKQGLGERVLYIHGGEQSDKMQASKLGSRASRCGEIAWFARQITLDLFAPWPLTL
jgi:hypothetical protein